MQEIDNKKRCFGGAPGKEVYALYHDTEWGIPSYDDQYLFQMLILEGAQAGLSWEIVLKKREAYLHVFHQFDPSMVAVMSDEELESLRMNSGIIRNWLKIKAARQNARVFLEIQKKYGSFSQYLWAFVDGKPIKNTWSSLQDVPVNSKESDALSKDLKKRGMAFVGSTILYAFMQAVGMVNDHVADC